MQTDYFQIAIDGHSSTGKSTLAKEIAKHLQILYIDSGAMYRAITWYAIQQGIIKEDILDREKLIASLPQIEVTFQLTDTYPAIVLNGVNVEANIRTMEVANQVSKVAAIPEVRFKLVELQRKISENQSVVMDGRDIGTVVFPKAKVKIFMTASAEIRAKRRFEELQSKGQEVSLQEVYANVVQRDEQDSNRKDSPLLQAEDAILLDNSFLSKEEQFQKVMAILASKGINF
ncbi:MAG: (d)CMP kinase [Flavobacterium sp.]